MKKLFPIMTDRTSFGHIFCVFVCWAFCFVVFPFLMPLIAFGSWKDYSVTSWFECIYNAINALMVMGILRKYLKESFFNVQMDPKGFARDVAITCVLMLIVILAEAWILFELYINPLVTLNAFPMSEMNVALTSGLMAANNPIFGTICLSLLTPFAITGLFYVTAFSPLACRWPALGYLVVAVVMLIPCAFDIFWREQVDFVLMSYVLRLPVHLLACWSYQKTDTVWAPILSLGVINLLTSLVNILILP